MDRGVPEDAKIMVHDYSSDALSKTVSWVGDVGSSESGSARDEMGCGESEVAQCPASNSSLAGAWTGRVCGDATPSKRFTQSSSGSDCSTRASPLSSELGSPEGSI